MVLVNRLGVINAAEQTRDIVLRDAHQGLDEEENVDDQAQDVMGGSKMGAIVGKFVIFDDNESGQECEDTGAIKDRVDGGALFFLRGGVGGLEDEDRLSG